MRVILIAVVAAASLVPASCAPDSQIGARSSGGWLPCTRRTVGFGEIPGEMARVQQVCWGVAACRRASNLETKEIAGSIHQNYLWGPDNTATSFDEQLQNSMLAEARNRALAARPGSKSIISISFSTDVITADHEPVYGAIGATAVYGDCPVSATTPR